MDNTKPPIKFIPFLAVTFPVTVKANNHSAAQVSLTSEVSLQFCSECGALLGDINKHHQWHADQDENYDG